MTPYSSIDRVRFQNPQFIAVIFVTEDHSRRITMLDILPDAPARYRLSAMAEAGSKDSAAVTLDRRWAALMAAAQTGDRIAYDRLLREAAPFVQRVAVRQGVPADRVDDVVQETLTTLHRIRAAYDPSRSFSAWLRAIAQRRSIDQLRRRTRVERREIHAPLAYDAFADIEIDHSARSEAALRTKMIADALIDLPAGQREAVEHLALRELSLEEAAVVTGRSKGALKVNLHRALKSLRSRLGMGG